MYVQMNVCPHCDSRFGADPTQGEIICPDCATVIDESTLDRGPEWRVFSPDEATNRSRVGAPLTVARHDRGLSTEISWRDKDARGNRLSERKRTQMRRLRTRHKRSQTRTKKERNLRSGLMEINRMVSALGLPHSVRETASVIYRRAHSKSLLLGRSIEGVASAAVYAAARKVEIPRTLEEVATVARVDRQRIGRAYRTIATELGLAIEPADPRAYLPRFASELDCSNATLRVAHELLTVVEDTTFMNGKHPAGLAGAALYAASQLTGEQLYQRAISDVADISCETIRTTYQGLLNHEETPTPE